MTAVATKIPTPVYETIQKPKDQLLGRRQAAEYISISISEFRRREKLDFYQPTLIDEKGWRFYSMSYLDSIRHNRSDSLKIGIRSNRNTIVLQRHDAPKSLKSYETEIAEKVFEALRNGMSGVDIVTQLHVHPDTFEAIYESWKRISTKSGGGIIIPAKILEDINNLPLPGTFPITNAEELFENLQVASKETIMCSSCNKMPGRICITCACAESESDSTKIKRK